MSICTREMIADKRLILSRHVVDGLFLLQGGSVGGSGAFKWLSEQLCEGETLRFPDDPFVEMSRMAGEIKAGSEGVLFLPYMSGERSPIWDPHARGVFYGLDFSKTRAHLIRACMEGVAYSLRHNCQVALEAGAKIERFFSMGGAANSLVWTQIKADVTGTPIDVPNTSSATTLGAAIVAGVGTGIYEGFEGAVDQCVRFTRSHEPDPANKGGYDEGFERYLELYQRLRPMMQG
jgi:xylulokinase